MKIIILILAIFLIAGCTEQKDIEHTEWTCSDSINLYDEMINLCEDDLNACNLELHESKDLKMFYVSEESLSGINIIKERWGFYYNSSNSHDVHNNHKFCEVAVWKFSDSYIYNRGNYYMLCG